MTLIEILSCLEVLKVLVVSLDLNLVLCALKEVLPLFETSDDRQELLVVKFVVALNRRQTL